MKHNLLHGVRYFFYIGLFYFQIQIGSAQTPKNPDDAKFKVSTALRELNNAPVNARMRKVPTGPQKLDLLQIEDGYVAIDAIADGPDGQELLRQLESLGLKKGAFYKRIVSGYFPIDKIDKLENIRALHNVSPAYKTHRSAGKVITQGDAALLANKTREQYNLTGIGSKIGVISDSYTTDSAGVAAGIASGDLPADAQILLDAVTGIDEGRGMTELIHDVAPGAKIAFHTAQGGQAIFAAGIQRLAQAGSNIIVDDVIYYAEPMFQDGIIAQSVDEVAKKNVSYFSSAGNNNRQSYEAPFRNSGKTVVVNNINYGVAHDFGNGDITQTIQIPVGGEFLIPFQWDDPFYSVSGGTGAQTDLDLLIYFNGLFLGSSESFNINRDPFEIIGITNPTSSPINIEVVITKFRGPDPQIIKWIDFGNATPLEHNTKSATVYGHSNAQSAISVGATAWFNTPEFNSNLKWPVINDFSSAGGTPILYTPDGERISPHFRQKPEVVGPDGGNTTFFGDDINIDADEFPNFFGTSAAAPHVAAIAALMQEARRNSLSPAAILENLISSTIDMDDPLTPGFDTGFDYQTGYGFVQATKALETTLTYGCNLSLTTKVVQAMPGWSWPNGVGAIDLTVMGGTGPYTYRWNSGTATEDIPKATPGLYSVTVTDATGCSATTTVNVGVMDTPLTLTSSVIKESRYGAGDGSIDLSVIGGTGPYTFRWNAGVATEDLPRATHGLYTVWVTDATGDSAYTAVYVSANKEPLALQTAHNPASRWVTDDGSIDLTVIGGVAPYTYRWNSGTATEDLPKATPGLYTVTVTDATGTTITTSVFVSVKTQPLALRASHTDATAWGENDGSIDLTIIGGVAPYKVKWNAGSAMEDLPRVLPGIYKVTITDAISATATLTVEVGVRGINPVLTARNTATGLELTFNQDKKTSLTAYPNPVNSRASIALTLGQDGDYVLAVYDLKGSLVKTLQQGKAQVGNLVEAEWEPKTAAKGIYILRLKTQHEVQNLRLLVK